MKDCETQPTAGPMDHMCSRMNARAAIENKIHELRRRAACLEILLDALPARLQNDADEALWEMALNIRA